MAGQDIRKLIPAGGGMPVNVAGDYIYLKFADRPIDVIINQGSSGQTRVTMEAGDKYRPGRFNQFEINNPDSQNPAQVVFTVGEGDYNRQIVQGEIVTAPGVRKADGTFQPDTRFTIAAQVTPVYGYAGEVVNIGDNLESATTATATEEIAGMWFDGSGIRVFTAMRFGAPEEARVWAVDPVGDSAAVIGSPEGTTYKTYALKPFSKVTSGYLFVDTISTVTDDNKLKYWNPAESQRETYLTVGIQIFDHQQIDDALYVLHDDNSDRRTLAKYNVDGGPTFAEEIDITHINAAMAGDAIRINWNPIDRKWTFMSGYSIGGVWIVETDADFNILDSYGTEGITFAGSGGGGNVYAIKTGGVIWVGFEQTVTKIAAEQTEKTLRGFASGVACNVDLLAEDYDNATTVAGVTVSSSNGRTKVTGQIIRAFLELYYRKRVSADYMDHVYALTLENPVSGAVTESVGGQGQTLDYLNVDDDFSAYFPAKIELMIDSELTFINPINY